MGDGGEGTGELADHAQTLGLEDAEEASRVLCVKGRRPANPAPRVRAAHMAGMADEELGERRRRPGGYPSVPQTLAMARDPPVCLSTNCVRSHTTPCTATQQSLVFACARTAAPSTLSNLASAHVHVSV